MAKGLVLPIVTLVSLLAGGTGCCDKEKVPALTSALYSSVAKERNDAALSLARCGESASDAVPRLAALLYDSNVGVQSSAAYALRKIDTTSARRSLASAEAARKSRKQ